MEFERREIEIDTNDVTAVPDALVYREFAIHRGVGRARDWFTITHLPTGSSFARAYCLFEREESARAALAEFYPLCNDWVAIDNVAAYEMYKRICEIGIKHGGQRVDFGEEWIGPNVPKFNGYQRP